MVHIFLKLKKSLTNNTTFASDATLRCGGIFFREEIKFHFLEESARFNINILI